MYREASSPAGLYFQQSCLLARLASVPLFGTVHMSLPLSVLFLLPAAFFLLSRGDRVWPPPLACGILEDQGRSCLLFAPSRAEGRLQRWIVSHVTAEATDMWGTCPRQYCDPPDLGPLVPKGKALRDKGVQGQESHSIISDRFPHILGASAVRWVGHGEAQGGAW